MSLGRRKFLIATSIFAVVHFCISWVAFTKSELIAPNETTEHWKVATRVLAFPLIYASDVMSAVDLFPVMMIANSLLWGAVIAAFFYGSAGMLRRTTLRKQRGAADRRTR